VQADGSQPLAEIVVATLPQLRRGMTLCIVTGSTERDWVRALAGLRRRGVGVVVVLLDRFSFLPDPAEHDDAAQAERARQGAEVAACRHVLAEYDIETHVLHAGDDLSQHLGGRIRGRA
jgi:intracellular sulfur oxidation DsrE/DsrF family protein